MTRLAGISAAQLAAVRKVRAAFEELPAEMQGRLTIDVGPLDQELDAACAAGDVIRAVAAIAAWRRWQLAQCEGAPR